MSHIILAPPSVSQVLFERLIADARQIALLMRGEDALQEPSAIEAKYFHEAEEFRTAYGAYINEMARSGPSTFDTKAAFLDFQLEWADLAYYALCHWYQVEQAANGAESSLWYQTLSLAVSRSLIESFNYVRGLDVAVLKYDRRASGAPKDVAAERLLIAHLFPGTAHLSNR